MSKMLKRLLILASVAAAMLMIAVPAFAQSPPQAENDARVTGVIQQVAPTTLEGTTFFITEDGTGDEYGLFSDAQGVDLSQYTGQRVTINGIFQTQGSNFDDLTTVPIYVTSVEIPEDSTIGEPVSVTGVLEPRGLAADRTDITHYVTDEASGELWGMISGDPASVLDPYNGQRVTVSGTDATQITFGGVEILAMNVGEVEPLDKGEKPAQPPTAPDGQYDPVDDPDVGIQLPIIVGPGDQYPEDPGNRTPGNTPDENPAAPAPGNDNPGQYDTGDGAAPGDQYDDGADKDVPPADSGSPDGNLSNVGSSGSGSSGGVLSVLPDTGGISSVTLGLISLLFLSGGLLTYAAIRQR